MLYVLFPAPGPLLGLGEAAEGVLTVGIFVPNEPILESMDPSVRGIVDEFAERASAEELFPTFSARAGIAASMVLATQTSQAVSPYVGYAFGPINLGLTYTGEQLSSTIVENRRP